MYITLTIEDNLWLSWQVVLLRALLQGRVVAIGIGEVETKEAINEK